MKALIFDMDGVLVNSTEYVTKAFNELLRKYGVALTAEYRKKCIGMSLRDQIKMWKKDFNIREEIDPINFSEKSFEIEQKLMEKELTPNKHLISLIDAAKKQKVRIAVATSSTKSRAEKILNLVGVFDKLDGFVTAEDVKLHKPHPQIFLKAAERLGVNQEECVVFEDALNGIQSAKKAGMKAVAILTTYTKKDDFKNTADLIINDFSEISLKQLENI